MEKTTLRINPELKRQAQIKALQDGISFQELVNTVLEEHLSSSPKKPVTWKGYPLGYKKKTLTRRDIYD